MPINPSPRAGFFLHNGWSGFVVLGAVFLAVTGGEALYADIGHFGTKPIRLTWFAVVLPALVLKLFRAGRAGASRSRVRGESLLPNDTVMGIVSDGRFWRLLPQ